MEDALLLPEENADIVGFIQNYVDGPGAQDPWLAQWTWQQMEHSERFDLVNLMVSNVRTLLYMPSWTKGKTILYWVLLIF